MLDHVLHETTATTGDTGAAAGHGLNQHVGTAFAAGSKREHVAFRQHGGYVIAKAGQVHVRRQPQRVDPRAQRLDVIHRVPGARDQEVSVRKRLSHDSRRIDKMLETLVRMQAPNPCDQQGIGRDAQFPTNAAVGADSGAGKRIQFKTVMNDAYLLPGNRG